MASRLQWTGVPLTGLNPAFVERVGEAASAAGATSIYVKSGYRSPSYNAQVGGVPDSNHIRGLAMDGTVTIPGKGTIPLGDLPGLSNYMLRSGNQPGFYRGGPDPNHVDAGYMATSLKPMNIPSALQTVINQASAKYNLNPAILSGIWQNEDSTYPNPYGNNSGYGGLFGTSNWAAGPTRRIGPNLFTTDQPTDPLVQADTAAQIFANALKSSGGDYAKAFSIYSGGGYTSVPGFHPATLYSAPVVHAPGPYNMAKDPPQRNPDGSIKVDTSGFWVTSSGARVDPITRMYVPSAPGPPPATSPTKPGTPWPAQPGAKGTAGPPVTAPTTQQSLAPIFGAINQAIGQIGLLSGWQLAAQGIKPGPLQTNPYAIGATGQATAAMTPAQRAASLNSYAGAQPTYDTGSVQYNPATAAVAGQPNPIPVWEPDYPTLSVYEPPTAYHYTAQQIPVPGYVDETKNLNTLMGNINDLQGKSLLDYLPAAAKLQAQIDQPLYNALTAQYEQGANTINTYAKGALQQLMQTSGDIGHIYDQAAAAQKATDAGITSALQSQGGTTGLGVDPSQQAALAQQNQTTFGLGGAALGGIGQLAIGGLAAEKAAEQAYAKTLPATFYLQKTQALENLTTSMGTQLAQLQSASQKAAEQIAQDLASGDQKKLSSDITLYNTLSNLQTKGQTLQQNAQKYNADAVTNAGKANAGEDTKVSIETAKGWAANNDKNNDRIAAWNKAVADAHNKANTTYAGLSNTAAIHDSTTQTNVNVANAKGPVTAAGVNASVNRARAAVYTAKVQAWKAANPATSATASATAEKQTTDFWTRARDGVTGSITQTQKGPYGPGGSPGTRNVTERGYTVQPLPFMTAVRRFAATHRDMTTAQVYGLATQFYDSIGYQGRPMDQAMQTYLITQKIDPAIKTTNVRDSRGNVVKVAGSKKAANVPYLNQQQMDSLAAKGYIVGDDTNGYVMYNGQPIKVYPSPGAGGFRYLIMPTPLQ